MKIEKVNIQDLISPAYNPRDMPPEEMEKLKTSITEFGYVDPIIVNEVNNHIIGGNQRYEAMKELNYEEVEVSYVHIEDLNREKALNIMLNKVSGEWDWTKLNQIFEEFRFEGFDTDLTGFDEWEIPSNNTFFDDNFDDSDIEEGGIDENFDTPLENETYTQQATFELKKGDEWDFGKFILKINDDFEDDKIKLEIYQDTFKASFDNFAEEDLLKDFVENNIELKDRLRNNGKFKSDIYG